MTISRQQRRAAERRAARSRGPIATDVDPAELPLVPYRWLVRLRTARILAYHEANRVTRGMRQWARNRLRLGRKIAA